MSARDDVITLRARVRELEAEAQQHREEVDELATELAEERTLTQEFQAENERLRAELVTEELGAELAREERDRAEAERDELRAALGGLREWPDLPRVEHHVERDTWDGIPFGRITVDGEVAYKGRWSSGLQALVDGATQASLASLALREVLARAAFRPPAGPSTDEDKL